MLSPTHGPGNALAKNQRVARTVGWGKEQGDLGHVFDSYVS